ncbi:hypothetical protein PoB_001755200 [Plakobranchus ocellatus]|uniref:Uncharacterized protein n=1 Tax=Plakobranchus ocellatus TaxID=259542 RepID=A0AAV3Z985_9GAST|nr:hypothetical protein PoB_001755200 [Plakobranchus ocellatus]
MIYTETFATLCLLTKQSTPSEWRIASPQEGDLRLYSPPSGQGADDGARTRNRRVSADLRADSRATVLPTPPSQVA